MSESSKSTLQPTCAPAPALGPCRPASATKHHRPSMTEKVARTGPMPSPELVTVGVAKTAPETTYVVQVAAPKSSGVWDSLLASAPGLLVALFAVALTHFYSLQREELSREAAARESLRLNAIQTRLKAMEAMTKSVLGMSRDVIRYQNLAYLLPTNAKDPAAEDESNYQLAGSLIAMYWAKQLSTEWGLASSQYAKARYAAAQHIQSMGQYQQQAVAAAPAILPIPPAVTNAYNAFLAEYEALEVAVRNLVAEVSAIAPALTNVPGPVQRPTGWRAFLGRSATPA
jgi:hypothetical protein